MGRKPEGDFNRRPNILECIRVAVLVMNWPAKSVVNTCNTTTFGSNIKTARFTTQHSTNVLANLLSSGDNGFNNVASFEAKMDLFGFSMPNWKTIFISAAHLASSPSNTFNP